MNNQKNPGIRLVHKLSYLNNAEYQITDILQKLIKSTSIEENKIVLTLLAEEIKNQIADLKKENFSSGSYHSIPAASQ